MVRIRRQTSIAACAALVAVAAASVESPRGVDLLVTGVADAAPAPVRIARLDATQSAPEVSPHVAASARRLIVKFEDGVGPRLQARLLRSAATSVDDRVAPLDLSVVDVAPREAADAEASLEASPHVEYVERDSVVRAFAVIPNDTLWSTQWSLQLLGLPHVWEVASRGETVPVAVIDSGIEAGHPDLAGLVGPGVDLVNGDGDPADDNGHGTAAAGVIAARADNGLGGAGICRTCSLIPIKVLDSRGAGTTSMVAEAIVWAVDHGARVISISLGSPTPTQTIRDAIAYASARGVILVAAAGNAGTSDPFYPAADAGVVSVGATMQDDALYEWSNRGAWVRLAAPGCNVAPALGGGYVSFCGTSSAAPLVAGLAATAIAQAPGAGLTRIEEALGAHAILVPHVARGRINARAVLAALGARVQSAPPVVPAAVRVVRGSFKTATQMRRFAQQMGKGRLRVVLRSASPRLTLAVADARGRVVARAGGRGVLSLARALPAGGYRIVVGGGRPSVRFVLSVTYPRTPREAAAWLVQSRT